MTGGGSGGVVGTGGGIVKSQNIAAGTPSMSSSTSSGYGSQAVSCSNLTNDDTYSIRSLSVGETPESMSPSNMRSDHHNAKVADCYTPAEINSGFNASAISSEFPKRVNPFLKDVANYDQLNGNQDEEDIDDDERVDTVALQVYNNNLKRASEPTILSSEMINEEDEGVDEQGDVEEDEEEEITRTIEEIGEEHQKHQERNQNVAVDEENNTSKVLHDSDVMESSFTTPSKHENIPEWVVVGESVQIRPYNTTGIIAFVGGTHFQGGTWIGVELDTPTGKNDGTVQGIQYFNCKQKHGIFVRVDKLILDKRGRAIRELKRAEKMKAEFAGQKGKTVSVNGPRK